MNPARTNVSRNESAVANQNEGCRASRLAIPPSGVPSSSVPLAGSASIGAAPSFAVGRNVWTAIATTSTIAGFTVKSARQPSPASTIAAERSSARTFPTS